eukprot:UN05998
MRAELVKLKLALSPGSVTTDVSTDASESDWESHVVERLKKIVSSKQNKERRRSSLELMFQTMNGFLISSKINIMQIIIHFDSGPRKKVVFAENYVKNMVNLSGIP